MNLEPGCLAIIVGYSPEVDGTEVMVIRFLGHCINAYGTDRWEVDREHPAVDGWGESLFFGFKKTNSRIFLNHFRAVHLMRIDGGVEEMAMDKEEVMA